MLCFSKVWQEIKFWGIILHFAYRFFRNFEFCHHIALIPQISPYMTPLSTFPVDKKTTRKKKTFKEKNIGVRHLTPFIYVTLVVVFLALC
jgi:hypothetical protein